MKLRSVIINVSIYIIYIVSSTMVGRDNHIVSDGAMLAAGLLLLHAAIIIVYAIILFNSKKNYEGWQHLWFVFLLLLLGFPAGYFIFSVVNPIG